MSTSVDTASFLRLDWAMNASLPKERYEAIVQDCLSGAGDLRVSGPYLNVLFCALPKSAGLHLTQLLTGSLGLVNHQIGFQRGGGQLYYPRLALAKFVGADTISHCHRGADPGTLALIRSLDLRPVVLTRNLLDCLRSRRDMLVRDRWAGKMLSPRAVERFLAAELPEQMDVVIDLFAPDYINFATGWELQRDAEGTRSIFATHEELVADEVGLVARIAAELGREVDPARVREVSEAIRNAGGINLSTGVAGRGRASLEERQIDRLRGLALALGCADEAFLGFPVGT